MVILAFHLFKRFVGGIVIIIRFFLIRWHEREQLGKALELEIH
jgi:hypothetical protein